MRTSRSSYKGDIETERRIEKLFGEQPEPSTEHGYIYPWSEALLLALNKSIDNNMTNKKKRHSIADLRSAMHVYLGEYEHGGVDLEDILPGLQLDHMAAVLSDFFDYISVT